MNCVGAVPGTGEFVTGGSDACVTKWTDGTAGKVAGTDPKRKTTHSGKVRGAVRETSVRLRAGGQGFHRDS